MTFTKTLDQYRAQFALQVVQEVHTKSTSKAFDEYASLVRGFPALIQTNGLAQAVAFLYAGKQSTKPLLLEHVTQWMLTAGGFGLPTVYVTPNPPQRAALLTAIVNGDSRQLRRASEEAKAFCLWLKRFTEGIKVEKVMIAGTNEVQNAVE